jgi:hypothetical protein
MIKQVALNAAIADTFDGDVDGDLVHARRFDKACRQCFSGWLETGKKPKTIRTIIGRAIGFAGGDALICPWPTPSSPVCLQLYTSVGH